MAWAPQYATAAEFKVVAGIPADDTADDVPIGRALEAASRAVDRATGRQFGKVASAEARYFVARWSRTRRRYVVSADDYCVAPTAVAVDSAGDETWAGAVDAYIKLPRNAAVVSRPWTELEVLPTSTNSPRDRALVKVTAVFGWASVPTTIVEATLLQASRFFSRRNAPFGVAGSPEVGSEMRLLAAVDPDVKVMLSPYVRRWAVV